MKIDIWEIEDTDTIIAKHNIGCLPTTEVNRYSKEVLKLLDEIFGKGKVAYMPVREGPTWDFTIIRKSPPVIKKS